MPRQPRLRLPPGAVQLRWRRAPSMSTDRKPMSETAGSEMALESIRSEAWREPWMIAGKTYRVALRRWSTLGRPNIVVYDAKSGKELAELSWGEGATMFGL